MTIKVALFDSGVGGLTVLRRCLQMNTNQQFEFLYLGDTARTPYGSKSPETIVRFSRECANFLLSKGAQIIVVACNTASSYSIDILKSTLQVPVIGTIEPAIEQLKSISNNNNVLVLGTSATISGKVYQNAIASAFPDATVYAIACPLFVSLVENNIVTGPIVDQVIDHYLSSVKNINFDSIILGCTHYPLISKSLSSYFNNKPTLISCSDAIASSLHKFAKNTVSSSNENIVKYFVTDSVKSFSESARILLDNFFDDTNLEKVEI